MVSQNNNSGSIWDKIKSKLSPDQEDQIKADDFASEKNVIAKYQTATKQETEERQNKVSATPLPPPPNVNSNAKTDFEVKKDTVNALEKKIDVSTLKAETPKPRTRRPELVSAPKTAAPQSKKPKKRGLSGADKVSYSPNPWQAPKILKTNLIRGEVTTFVSWSKYINTAVIALGLSLALLFVLFFGLIYWETIANQEGEALVAEIKQVDMRINQLRKETKEVDQFQRRMNLAGELLDKHIYWTKYFDVLESILLKEARITNAFSGSLDGIYNFSIEVNSFESIYDQLRVLREHPAVLSAHVNSGTFVKDKSQEGEDYSSKVEFNLELSLDPEIFFDKKIDEK